MVGELDGPHIGIGRAPSLESHACRVVVQCCLVTPPLNSGSGVIMTGRITNPLTECIEMAMAFIHQHGGAVAKMMNVEGKRTLRWVKKGLRDLHVHVEEYGWEPVSKSEYMGAVVMAMISLFVGRRPYPDAAILGEANPCGMLVGTFDWKDCGRNSVERWRGGGIRHLVIANDSKIDWSVVQMLSSIQSDGKPLVQLHRVGTIQEAIPYLFPMP